VTFDLQDGSFMMVASHMEDTFEGLRLYRYRFEPDSAVHMLAVSPPAYDSWTMLPTFFPVDPKAPHGAQWITANFGEKESWGQKLLRLDGGFEDIGFLDIAKPEREMEDDTLRLKRRNIGPSTRVEAHGDTTVFTFICDSVYLYDDQNGHTDLVVPATTIHYTFHPSEGLALWLRGYKRLVKKTAS
jgi:hypothetical protein